MANEFISDGDYIYLNKPYAEVYIADSLFTKADQKVTESAIAYQSGTGYMVVGVFDIRFFNSDEEARDSKPLRTFCYPNVIETQPSDIAIAKIIIRGEEDKYRIFKYYQGDIIMHAAIKQSVRNCEQFMGLITSGKIPKSLSYPKIFDTWMKNFEINGISPEVPSVVIQTIIATMCRNPENPREEFRKIAGKGGNVDLKNYLSVNMNQASAYSSTMSALSFERVTEKLTTSLITTKDGAEQPISPIEKVLTM